MKMKKILMMVMVSLGLQLQAQTLCDYTYTTGSQYQLEIAIGQTGNGLPTMAPIYVVTYGGQDMLGEDSCFSGPCNHLVPNYNMSTGMPYDTITTCISYSLTDSLGYVDTMSCCFNQVWDGQAWMLMSNTVGIEELYNTEKQDYRIFNVLGRQLIEAPIGEMYIQNRKKYIKLR